MYTNYVHPAYPTTLYEDVVKITVFRQEGAWGLPWNNLNKRPGNAQVLIEWLQAQINGIPADYRHTASIDFEDEASYENSSILKVEFYYTRPMTESELRERDNECDRAQRAKAAEERAQYERLKQKFGG